MSFVKIMRTTLVLLFAAILGWLPSTSFAAASGSCYQYAKVSLHRNTAVYETPDTVIFLDVILLPPIEAAYDKPALSNAASAFLSPKLTQLKVKDTMTSSQNFSFLGCAGTKAEIEKKRASDIQEVKQKLLSGTPGATKYLEIVHGNWFVEKGKKVGKLPAGYIEQVDLIWTPLMPFATTSEATARCAAGIDGKTGWRLPTTKELRALSKTDGLERLLAGHDNVLSLLSSTQLSPAGYSEASLWGLSVSQKKYESVQIFPQDKRPYSCVRTVG